MTRTPPPYFQNVKSKTESRWNLLNDNPDIAGPWWQLFKQVQSPRHVVSELLQNADDCGATYAKVRIEENIFIFEHNGKDFNENKRGEFSSLCGFGSSNKRNLHTIGFRGIGFKSTFSLGDKVILLTPSLSVEFHSNRFTDPIWIPDTPLNKLTTIKVPIADSNRRKELEKNLKEWRENPGSLLFFKNIRSLSIGDETLKWIRDGPGPVPKSEVFRLTGNSIYKVIMIQSPEEDFPPEAKKEIEQERMTNQNEDFYLPPCSVEIIIGLPHRQRIYTILPTDVNICTNFSCNAPFMQDPARERIKGPSISETNRWLLSRIGKLAVDVMIQWLNNDSLTSEERAEAYNLVIDIPEVTDSLEGSCNEAIFSEFKGEIFEKDILLTMNNKITNKLNCFVPPIEFYEIWESDQILDIFSIEDKSLLSPFISPKKRNILSRIGLLDLKTDSWVLEQLKKQITLPKPNTWDSLAVLWEYIRNNGLLLSNKRELPLIPIINSNFLIRIIDSYYLGKLTEKINLGDIFLISQFINIFDPKWLNFIKVKVNQEPKNLETEKFFASNDLLSLFSLQELTRINQVLNNTYREISTQKEINLDYLIRITQLYAHLGIAVPDYFKYLTRKGDFCYIESGVLAQSNLDIEELFPPEMIKKATIHELYHKNFISCTEKEWSSWINSEKSGIRGFLGFKSIKSRIFSIDDVNFLIQSRGAVGNIEKKLSSSLFNVEDYDFDSDLIKFWNERYTEDELIWVKVVEAILRDSAKSWEKYSSMEINQMGTTKKHVLTSNCRIRTAWMIRLASLPCLPDDYQRPQNPSELLLRNERTESFLGIEKFILKKLDTEENEGFLINIGVRDTPAGINSLVNRIRNVSQNPELPTQEIARWYNNLDRILNHCTTSELIELKKIFRNENLIYTEKLSFTSSDDVFLDPGDLDLPGVSIVHSSVRHLIIWEKIGVATRPTIDLLIEWLATLKSGSLLQADDLKQVKKILTLDPEKTIIRCNHWISLQNIWSPVSSFKYKLTKNNEVRSKDFFSNFKEIIADMRMISDERSNFFFYQDLPDIRDVITYKVTKNEDCRKSIIQKPWLSLLAGLFSRIIMDEPETTERVRKVADRLNKTKWINVESLGISPYIEKIKAGDDYEGIVFWDKEKFFVKNLPLSDIFEEIVQELSYPFKSSAIKTAIHTCVERPVEFVQGYLMNNNLFKIEPEIETIIQISNNNLNITPNIIPNGECEIIDLPFLSGLNSIDHSLKTKGMEDSSIDSDLVSIIEEDNTNLFTPEEKTQDKPNREHRNIIEEYTKKHGYRYNPDNELYIHQNGAYLKKMERSIWQKYDHKGSEVGQFLVTSQSLYSTTGITIPAEWWNLMKKYEEFYGLITPDEQDIPREISGKLLMENYDLGKLELVHPHYKIKILQN